MVKLISIWVAVIVLAIAGSLALYAYRSPVYAEMNALKLIPQQEPFTELYFENPSALPAEVIAGKPNYFGFVIHNLEGATTTYPYVVYLKYPSGQEGLIMNGTTTLAENTYKIIGTRFTIASSTDKAEVVVLLPKLNQQIDFYLEQLQLNQVS